MSSPTGSLLVADVSSKPAGPESASVTFTLVVTGTSLWLGGHRVSGSTLQDEVGAVVSMLTVLMLADPASAPSLPAPSTAVHVMSCVPSPFTRRLREALPVPPPSSGPTVSPPAPSVHVIAVTFAGSVAVTLPAIGLWEALKNPPWPSGGAGNVTVTAGGVVSLGGGVDTILSITASSACATPPPDLPSNVCPPVPTARLVMKASVPKAP